MTLGSEKPLRHHLGANSSRLLTIASALQGWDRKDAVID